ncbi:uncharacterized protein LOC135594616 [Musa acuminata AAA Group]|uniref:(wild Malaysian banana) hypothetical protein n=1 Tax=Musa acuminata subsp. malaccensis TaxID=214687 RepID=A0A804L1D3_MUSAM|nr:PREDICTED: uncharacterized protein LOC103969480 [Musa acuminata subsp. malaccensis]CAG1854880.1 unnamed protein product [Musa acuminata subsp. malaccensis]
MDPCPFVRVLVGNLALKGPVAARPAGGSGVHPSAHPCFATVRLDKHPSRHTAAVPLLPPDDADAPPPPAAASLAAGFHLSKADLDRIAGGSFFSPASASGAGTAKLKVAIYSGGRGTTCLLRSRRLLGRVSLPLDLRETAEGRAVVFHSGWVALGKGASAAAKAQLYLTVKAEVDPRFVFEFDGEPERNPQVFQVQGNRRQPVYTCSFGCRHHSGDWNWGSRSAQSEPSSSRRWRSSMGSERERLGKERKGWSVTVHDLSGSPVALASMVTPFVASPGTDRVSRSNPGAWLILRPGDGTWQPWGRLEAWRERGGGPAGDGLGYRFELLPDTAAGPGVTLAESTISASKGGKFAIDLTGAGGNPLARTPSSSGRSGELVRRPSPCRGYRGFVMSSTVASEGTGGPPAVEVGVQHVGCAEDAAAFVALAAAVDLSMNACRLFSHKLRRGLSSSATLR